MPTISQLIRFGRTEKKKKTKAKSDQTSLVINLRNLVQKKKIKKNHLTVLLK